MSDRWLGIERAGDRAEEQDRRERGLPTRRQVPLGHYVTLSPTGSLILWREGWDETVAILRPGQARWQGCHGEPEGWEPW